MVFALSLHFIAILNIKLTMMKSVSSFVCTSHQNVTTALWLMKCSLNFRYGGILLLFLRTLSGKRVSARSDQVLGGLLHGNTLLHFLELHLREEGNEKWESQ